VHRGDRDGHWPKGVAADLKMTEMELAPDGSYEIVLSAEEGPGNWMRLDPDAGSLIARFYFQNERCAAADPSTVPVLEIERFADRSAPTPPAPDAEIAKRLERAANWVRSKYGYQILPRTGRSRPEWFSSVPNLLGKPAEWVANQQGGGWGAVDVAYSAGPYALEDDEALVMEGRLPRGVFSNVVLWNEMGRTEDYRDRRISLNARQMELDTNRRFRIVVAHRDPGVKDWLDSAGRAHGTIYWRHMLPEEPPERASCRVVPFDALIHMEDPA